MLQVACTVPKGDLPITFSWFFNGAPLQLDENVGVSRISPRASFLTISSVGQTHRGNYTCQATNSGGSHSFTAPLEVNGIKHLISRLPFLLVFYVIFGIAEYYPSS